MGSSNPVFTVAELRHQRLYQTAKMSLWKGMTMSQVARQGAQAYEAHAAGKFVWGKEGFKWMSDDKGNSTSSQDNSSESPSRSEQQESQLNTRYQGDTTRANLHQSSW